MTIASKFEIHYFLDNDSHSMDAVVKNRCEAEFLAVAYEIIDFLELDITLNAEALKEGGVKDFFNFLLNETSYSDKVATIALVFLLIQIAISLVPQTDSKFEGLKREEIELSIEEKKLSIEEKKLNIQKLKNELSDGNISEETLESTKIIINKNPKIVTRRSNFYKTLNINKEVTQVSFSQLDKNHKTIGNEIIVPRTDFIYFIQRTNKLPMEIDENAAIEIVAPVLREGKAKWKGIYNDEQISFFMDDHIYKAAVLSKRISFKNGDVITCVLEIHKELNEVGEIVITKYSVQTVLDKIENGIPKETPSGEKYRRERKIQDSQGDLFKSELS